MRAPNTVSGVAIAEVVDRNAQGEVRLRYPWMDAEPSRQWVRVAAPMAGDKRGAFLAPEVGDEVLVAFELGRMDHPIVIAALWNGQDRPPADDPRERVIASRNGHRIRMLDPTPQGGAEGALVIEDAHGNRITLSNGQIRISAAAVLRLEAPSILVNGRVVLPVPTPI